MPRKYRHIGDYEKEIIEMWTNGMTLREIGEKLGFTLQEMKDFKSRYNKKQSHRRRRNRRNSKLIIKINSAEIKVSPRNEG